ncbi:hypothetical protein D3C87_2145620 [compost metagenome]
MLGGDIVRGAMPNNRASDMEAMRDMHAIWNVRFESTSIGRLRLFQMALEPAFSLEEQVGQDG